MKKTVRKFALNRETLRSLENGETLRVAGARTNPCYPPTYGPSCYEACPTQPFSRTNCG